MPAKGRPPELYDVAADPNETTDRAADKPELVTSLRQELEKQRKLDP